MAVSTDDVYLRACKILPDGTAWTPETDRELSDGMIREIKGIGEAEGLWAYVPFLPYKNISGHIWLRCAASAGAWLFAYGADYRPGGSWWSHAESGEKLPQDPVQVWCHYLHSELCGAGARHVDNVYQYVAFSSSVVVAQAYVAQHDTWQKSG